MRSLKLSSRVFLASRFFLAKQGNQNCYVGGSLHAVKTVGINWNEDTWNSNMHLAPEAKYFISN